MALHVRPAYLQGLPADDPNAGPGRSAAEDRNTLHALVGRSEGTLLPGDFAVTPGTGLRVNVAPGDIFITVPASKALRGGSYHAVNDAVYSQLLDPAPTVGARLDWFGIRVLDRQFNEFANDGSTDKVEWFYRSGTPATGTGQQLPAVTDVPGTLYRLASVPVGQSATSVGTIAQRAQPLVGAPAVEWVGDDTGIKEVFPSQDRFYSHPTRIRLYQPAQLVGTISYRIVVAHAYCAVSLTATLGGLALSAIDPFITPVTGRNVVTDPDFSRHGQTHTVVITSPLLPAGLHTLSTVIAVSAGSQVGAQVHRWRYALHAYSPGPSA